MIFIDFGEKRTKSKTTEKQSHRGKTQKPLKISDIVALYQ